MKIRTHDIILNKLGSSIVKGKILPLENIPSDTELCREYDIGRNTLREVFKVLSAKGLLEASPRKGTWVKEQSNWDIYDPDVLGWSIGTPLHTKILLDVSEARVLIEPAAARMAAKNARVSDVAVIEEAYERMKSANPQTVAACQADVDFHIGVFKASHNMLWIKFGQVLSFTLMQLFKTSALQERYVEELPMHKRIFQAIRLKDEEDAEKNMKILTSHAASSIKTIVNSHFKSSETGRKGVRNKG